MKIEYLLCFMVAVITVFFMTYAYADDLSKNVFISNAWVQAMPPAQKTTAVYMVIANNSQKEIILTSASSDIAGATEIHQMSDRNGMMNMAMVPDVRIPALGKVALKPGGFHIMLIGLKKPVNKGDIVPITLHFQYGGSIMVNAQAKPQAQEDSSSMPGMKM